MTLDSLGDFYRQRYVHDLAQSERLASQFVELLSNDRFVHITSTADSYIKILMSGLSDKPTVEGHVPEPCETRLNVIPYAHQLIYS